MKTLQQKFRDAIFFSESLANEARNNIQELFSFLTRFKEIYDKEEKKLPYHINLIDELRANENAHSRILVKLLQKYEVNSQQYEILESFIHFIIKKDPSKVAFHKIKIDKPIITQEKKRIDLWIRDGNNYSIIIENKINNAIDQNDGKNIKGGQLERYINITKEEFPEEKIYVLYLPPTYEKEPNMQTWGKYYEGEIHNNRYLNLSFKDDILPWLKNKVLPNIRLKDRYLSSAIEQYIDHLEGKFNLRTINRNMNMELQEFIKKELDLELAKPEEALQKVVNKKNEMVQAMNQLSELEEKIKLEYFPNWKIQLCKKFSNYLCEKFSKYQIVDDFKRRKANLINVGVKINLENNISFSLIIEYDCSNKKLYYGISTIHTEEGKRDTLNFDKINKDFNFDTDDEWYGWRYTLFTDAYEDLKTLIEIIGEEYM